MTLDDLAEALVLLQPGQAAGINKDAYADLFPPGEPDENARARCYQFAHIYDCRIDHTRSPGGDAIWFLIREPPQSMARRLCIWRQFASSSTRLYRIAGASISASFSRPDALGQFE